MLAISKAVDFTGTMLDIAEFAESEIQKHQVSRNQYPGSRNISDAYHHNGPNLRKYFMQFKG
jgi:hypothetical protein